MQGLFALHPKSTCPLSSNRLSEQGKAGHTINSLAWLFPGHTGESGNEGSFVLGYLYA